MKIKKEYQLHLATASDELRPDMQHAKIYADGKAIATDGHMIACVPVAIEEGDVPAYLHAKQLRYGRSITKGKDAKGKAAEVIIKLHEGLAEFGNKWESPIAPVDKFPDGVAAMLEGYKKEEKSVFIGLDVNLLSDLCKAIGTSRINLAVCKDSGALYVMPLGGDNEAEGILMPIKISNE